MIHLGTFILAFLLLVSPARAADPWTKTNYVLHGAYTTIKIIDYTQTLHIARHPDAHFEYNPVLSRHPSVSRVNLYFASTYVATTILAYILNKPYREILQIGLVIGNGAIVTFNIRNLR